MNWIYCSGAMKQEKSSSKMIRQYTYEDGLKLLSKFDIELNDEKRKNFEKFFNQLYHQSLTTSILFSPLHLVEIIINAYSLIEKQSKFHEFTDKLFESENKLNYLLEPTEDSIERVLLPRKN